jgi:hypothetical protein
VNTSNPEESVPMKIPMLVAAIATCALLAPIVSAQEMPTPASPSMSVERQTSEMHENMKKMQQQMQTIRATTDPKIRQKLMAEHMEMMQGGMKSMRSMGGPVTMGGGQGGGMAMGEGKGMGSYMMQHHEMVEKRIDMMQMMMAQMMQHEQMTESMPPK